VLDPDSLMGGAGADGNGIYSGSGEIGDTLVVSSSATGIFSIGTDIPDPSSPYFLPNPIGVYKNISSVGMVNSDGYLDISDGYVITGVNTGDTYVAIESGVIELRAAPFKIFVSSSGLRYDSAFTGPLITWGSGSPEGVITAPIGSSYYNTAGGVSTTLYVKTSGAGNTGWTAK